MCAVLCGWVAVLPWFSVTWLDWVLFTTCNHYSNSGNNDKSNGNDDIRYIIYYLYGYLYLSL